MPHTPLGPLISPPPQIFSFKWGRSHRWSRDHIVPSTQGLQLPNIPPSARTGSRVRACPTLGHPCGHRCMSWRWWCLQAPDQQARSVHGEVGGRRGGGGGGGKNPLISEEMSQIRFVNQKPIYNMQELICFIFLSYIFVKHI